MVSPIPEDVDSPLHALSIARFGRATHLRRTLNTGLDAGGERILTNNPNRVAVQIVNTGLDRCIVNFRIPTSAQDGFVIPPNGGVYQMRADEDGELVGYELFGLPDGGGENLRIFETIAL